MIRKIIYVLIAVVFVLAMDQLFNFGSQSATLPSGPTGKLEVRMTASSVNEEITAANITISSVEIYLPNGWRSMELSKSKTFDLVALEGMEETVAFTDLQQGTYTQIRVNISKAEVAVGGKANEVKMTGNKLTFTQNFTITANTTSVILLDLDTERSLNYSDTERIIFKPYIYIWESSTRSSGGFQRTVEAMRIITNNLPNGEVGVPYFTTLVAFGGQRPYIWKTTMGDLPAGLELDRTNGIISGTPTVAGNFGFTIEVKDDAEARNNATIVYRVNIADEGVLQIITGGLPNSRVKDVYHYPLEAIGGMEPYTWTITSNRLPDGLELDASTGVISGIPTRVGDFSFTIKITDNDNPSNSDMQRLEIDIAQEVLAK